MRWIVIALLCSVVHAETSDEMNYKLERLKELHTNAQILIKQAPKEVVLADLQAAKKEIDAELDRLIKASRIRDNAERGAATNSAKLQELILDFTNRCRGPEVASKDFDRLKRHYLELRAEAKTIPSDMKDNVAKADAIAGWKPEEKK